MQDQPQQAFIVALEGFDLVYVAESNEIQSILAGSEVGVRNDAR